MKICKFANFKGGGIEKTAVVIGVHVFGLIITIYKEEQ